jgi:hypothetical protein
MEQLIDRLKRLVEFNCREVIDPDHEVTVESVGGAENRLCRKFCLGGHEGAVALVSGGIRQPGSRTIRPQ